MGKGKTCLHSKLLWILFLLIPILLGNIAAAELNEDTVIIQDATNQVILDPHIEILEDKSHVWTIEDVSNGSISENFVKYEGKGRPNFGYSLSRFWVRIQIVNQTDLRDWLLEINSPKINEIILYTKNEHSGVFEERVLGNWKYFKDREIVHRNFLYPILLENNEINTVYMRFFTGGAVQIPLTLWTLAAHDEQTQLEYLIFGGFFGISMIMMLYHLFLYFSTRNRSYLYYILFVAFNMLLLLAETGLAYQYLWPHLQLWNVRSISSLVLLSAASGLLFGNHFLDARTNTPRIYKASKIIIAASLTLCIARQLPIVTQWNEQYSGIINTIMLPAMIMFTLLSIILIIMLAILSVRRGYYPARYFLVAWGVFSSGVMISLFVDMGMIALIDISKYAWAGSTVLEMILLALALGNRFNMIQKEKETAVLESQINQQLALDALRRADQLKDEFLTTTSHELRTPLNGIIGIAETLRDGAAGDVSDDIQAHLSMIIMSGKRLSNLVNDILDLSKLKSGELRLNRTSVKLYELVDVVLTICRPLVKNKPVRLVNEIPDHLPPLYIDENRVQQILYNLVGNAIKYTSSGEIIVYAVQQGEEVEVCVEDTGKGIPSEELSLIFEPYHQGNNESNEEITGTGIGLNITKKLVELHDGHIRVDSQPGRGSRFFFTIPVNRDELSSNVEAAAALQYELPDYQWINTVTSPVENAANKNVKVLIADDEPINLQVLTNQLALEGFNVVSVSDGQSVIDYLNREQYDLLIIDIMMPNMSGYEVCRRLRERYTLTELPILMLTAKNQVHDIVTAFEVGANDYLTKPCDRRELISRVETLILLRQANAELIRINQSLEEMVHQRTHELAEVNNSLRMTNEKLLDMTETRRRLLANISHELGTPISLIHSYFQAFQEGIIDKDDFRYASMVSDRIKVLERLTQDLLDLSKFEAGQMKLNLEETNLIQWLENMIKQCTIDVAQGERKFIHRSIENDKEEWAEYYCRIDHERMTQVFSNLVWNAIKYTSIRDGEIKLDLFVRHNEIVVVLIDNGTGIAKEELPYLFERFYRVESNMPVTDQVTSGTGLGLAIVKEIVQHHHGKVWAESDMNKGSSFYIALPVWKGSKR